LIGGAAQQAARFRELDVFRGVAALWVVLFHYVLRYQALYGRTETAPAWLLAYGPRVSGPDDHFGELPVFWFFMISGYVIVWSLQRCRATPDFAVSRFSRLYPAYWAAVALTFAVGALAPMPGQVVTPGQLLGNLTMLQDALGVPSLDGAYWSLLPELIFYVLVGSVFALGQMQRLPLICIAWMAACLAVPVLKRYGVWVPWRIQTYALLTYGPFFAMGIACFQLREGRQPAEAAAIIALALATVALSYRGRDAWPCAGFLLLFLLAVGHRLRWIAIRPLVWLGSVSFGLYVSHEMLGWRLMAAAESAGLPRVAAILLALLCALLLADLITRLVEQPALHAIRRAWRRA